MSSKNECEEVSSRVGTHAQSQHHRTMPTKQHGKTAQRRETIVQPNLGKAKKLNQLKILNLRQEITHSRNKKLKL